VSRSTLRARLAAYYAIVLVVLLAAFAATVYAIIEAEEAAEPPEVAALEPPDHTGRKLAIALVVALVVAVPIAVGGALVISRRGLRGLDDVVATAGRISTEHLDERIPMPSNAPAEIAGIVTSVNAMLDRLEHSVRGIRRFTADASHELRTPLTAIMGGLEVTLRHPRNESALRATVESSLEQLQDLHRLVESLLALAQSDASALPIAPVDLNLAQAVRRIAEPYEAALGTPLQWELDETACVRTDPLWLGRIVANLLDNAYKHAPGAEVTVRVTSRTVEVSDSGPGIAAADRERIFERFHRGAASRARGDGFGLGLPLAREVARALGGDLVLHDGARFVLSLSVASNESDSAQFARRTISPPIPTA
jgi:two-component system, OmpR family, sensor kinase